MVVLVLLFQVLPSGIGRMEEVGMHVHAYDAAGTGSMWGLVGEKGNGQGWRVAFAALFENDAFRCTLEVPELSAFVRITPGLDGFSLWGQKGADTLVHVHADTLCNVQEQDTLVLSSPVEGLWPEPSDTVVVLSGDRVLWLVPGGVVDSVLLPSRVHVKDLLPLPDGSLGLVGWVEGLADTVVPPQDGWVARMDRSGDLLFADTLQSLNRDVLHRMVRFPETGVLCVAGMMDGDGYVAWYTPSGTRVREARVGAPADPFLPAWEWAQGCFLEEGMLVFPGWKSPYGFPDASPFMGVVQSDSRVDTVSLDLPFAQTTGVLRPFRLGSWRYGFVRNIISGMGWGAVEYALYEDHDPPDGDPVGPDTISGEMVWLAFQARDAFSGVDTVSLFFRYAGDSSWTVHRCREQEVCGTLVSLPEEATGLVWYARVVDHAGNARRFPDTGTWTVVRVGVTEGMGLPAPEMKVVPGGLQYRLPTGMGLVILDLQGRKVFTRRGGRGRIALNPGTYILRVGNRTPRVVVIP